jgi:ribonuclease J
MKITIYRGTKEIGGTLIEIKSSKARVLIDAGYPLFLNGKEIDNRIAKLPHDELLQLGVLPKISGLYAWDTPSFEAVIISHAHIDHYGLIKYIHPAIPVFLSAGTQKLIELSQRFKITDNYPLNAISFSMYQPFIIGDFTVKPYLMDHSAFDAAAFEITGEGKTILYSGDFRGHGRKAVCLDYFISGASKQADILLTEGTMFGRPDEKILSESGLEDTIIGEIGSRKGPVLFQSSSQNIDRLVTFFRVAQRLKKQFVVDVYTANVLYDLHGLGNHLPYPSKEYSNIKVFYPYRLAQKIFNDIGGEYAKRFSSFHLSKEELHEKQNDILMAVRPSMRRDIELCDLQGGLFIYSMWQGYRGSKYQQDFEQSLVNKGFGLVALHTSGHAAPSDIRKLITGLNPKKIIPIHTMTPEVFNTMSDKVELKEDGREFEV